MEKRENTEFEVIDLNNPEANHGPDAETIEVGKVFEEEDLMEEYEEEDDYYDDAEEDEEETVTNAYYGDYSAGRFQAVGKKNKLDDLNELLQNSEKFEHALEQTQLSGALYVDPEFHPNKASLVGYSQDYQRNKEMGQFKFERSSVYFGPDVQVYDTMSPGDIIQGQLGDCYFLAAVSSIAEHPDRLQRLFLSKRNHGNGIYAVAMCLNGVWEEIVMDDFAPCTRSGKLAFNTSQTNEMWVVLLEKAWAKVHGGYLNIEAGLTREALRDLTGASAKTYFLKQKPEEIWERLMDAEKSNFIMTAGSDNLNSGSDAYIKKIGICGSHAYSLLAVYQLYNQGGRYVRTRQGQDFTDRLVKLRNPWGQGEWKGEWSDTDRRWTPSLKQALGFTGKKEDGIFYMSWEEFQNYYSDCQICYYHDGYKYSAEKYKSKKNETVYLKFHIATPGKYYFSVNQRNRRFYPKNSGYKYTKIGWVMGRDDGARAEFVGSGNKADKENWDAAECQPGLYYVMVDTPWRSISREFSFSVYGPGLTEMEKVTEQDLPRDFVRNVFKSKARSDMPKRANNFAHRKHPKIQYVSGEKNGWAYMYFQNDESDHQIKVTLKLGDGSTPVKLLPPHSGYKPTMVVGPGENEIIVYKNKGRKAVSVSMMTSFKKVGKKKVDQGGGQRVPSGGGHSQRHPYPGSGGKVRPYPHSGGSGGRVIRYDGGGRVVRPDNNGGGGRVVRPDYNGGGGRVIRYDGGGGRVVRPDHHGGGGRVVRPDYHGGGGRVVRPDYHGGGGRVIRPDRHDGGGRVIRPYQPTRGGDSQGRRDDHRPSHNNTGDLATQARNSKIKLSKKLKGRPVDIDVHFYYHPRGLALMYVNNTHDMTLSESISFKLRNARISGASGSELKFELGPGQEKLIELVRNNNSDFEARIDRIMYDISRGGYPVRRY